MGIPLRISILAMLEFIHTARYPVATNKGRLDVFRSEGQTSKRNGRVTMWTLGKYDFSTG